MSSIEYPCPKCGQVYTLEEAYLAQYGGQMTTCSKCRQAFQLPAAVAPTRIMAAPDVPAAGSPRSGAPTSGKPVLGYLTSPLAASTPVWREGKKLVAAVGTVLPNQCIKCGQPGVGKPFKRVYYWHHPPLYLTILAGLILYAIVAVCVQKKATVTASLCQEHRSKRGRSRMISWLVTLSSIAFFMLASSTRDRDLVPLLIMGGIVALIGGLIAVVISGRIFTPTRIDAGYVWLQGAREPFLSQFPAMNTR